MTHVPVLLHEVISGLNVQPNDIVVDATLGGGGYSEAVCRMSQGITLIGIDQDQKAIDRVRERLSFYHGPVHLVKENFRHLTAVLDALDIAHIDRVMFDLGFSTDQLEGGERGFSFAQHEPLLMTFNDDPTEAPFTARDIVNDWREDTIADVLYGYGEERFARRIARAIVTRRDIAPIEYTDELVEVIQSAVPGWYMRGKRNVATKTFQALRIAVNDELGALKEGLTGALGRLRSKGRIAVVSFHSVEDRIVKHTFREEVREGRLELVTRRPIRPTREEITANPRSRSAKLRIAEKV